MSQRLVQTLCYLRANQNLFIKGRQESPTSWSYLKFCLLQLSSNLSLLFHLCNISCCILKVYCSFGSASSNKLFIVAGPVTGREGLVAKWSVHIASCCYLFLGYVYTETYIHAHKHPKTLEITDFLFWAVFLYIYILIPYRQDGFCACSSSTTCMSIFLRLWATHLAFTAMYYPQ